MSRAHAVAPLADTGASYRGPSPSARMARAARVRRDRTVEGDYIERAMLLWPRLDRARLRKIGDDPARLAGFIERRTSQPHDVIVAMLTRETERLAAPTETAPAFDSGRSEAARLALRVVRTEAGTRVGIQDLRPPA